MPLPAAEMTAVPRSQPSPSTPSLRAAPRTGPRARLDRWLGAVALAVGLWSLIGASAVATAQAAEARPLRRSLTAADADPVGGPVIVQLRAGGTLQRAQGANAGATALTQRVRGLAQRQGLTLEVGAAVGARSQVVRASGLRRSELLRRLAADPEVEFAEPDRPMRAHAAPNDPRYTAVAANPGPVVGQWYLRSPNSTTPTPVAASDFEGAWAITQGSADIVVAVLDTGVRPDHPDLLGKLLPGYDFVSTTSVGNDGNGRDPDPSDPGDWVTQADIDAGRVASTCTPESSSWHGTLTTALVGAATQNAIGMAGAGRHVRVLPVRVLGKCGGFTSDIAAAMKWAAGISVPGVPDNSHPAKVINLSLGGPDSCSETYRLAVNEVLARGVVVVASAGNDGLAIGEPANCSGVIGVAGVRHEGTKNGFSDLGPEVTVSAPGGNCVSDTGPCLYPILSASNTGTQGPAASSYTGSGADASFGTSFAAPLVSATAALLASVRPGATPAQIRAWIQNGTRAFPTPPGSTLTECRAPSTVEQGECICTTTTCGAGMLDAAAAVALAASGATVAHVDPASTQVAVGSSVVLDAAGSRAGNAGALAGYHWQIVEGASAAAFSGGASSADTVAPTLTTSAERDLLIRLTVTDSGAGTASASVVIRAGNPPSDVVNSGTTTGSGGGALGGVWLLGLAGAVALLAGLRRRDAAR